MNITKLTFRDAQLEDIPSIIQIEHTSFSHAICESKEVFIERIGTFPKGFRLMLHDDKVIGYICSEIWKGEGHFTEKYFTLGHSIADQHDINGRELYVSSMGILPLYRSKGLGKQLFDEFIKYAVTNFHQIETIILIVSEKWVKARKIYSGQGFKPIHKIEGFFDYTKSNPSYFEDGIVMRKKLITK